MVQNKLIEIPSARFLTDVLMHNFLRQLLKRQSVSQRLAATLKCERHVNITDREALSIDCAD